MKQLMGNYSGLQLNTLTEQNNTMLLCCGFVVLSLEKGYCHI